MYRGGRWRDFWILARCSRRRCTILLGSPKSWSQSFHYLTTNCSWTKLWPLFWLHLHHGRSESPSVCMKECVLPTTPRHPIHTLTYPSEVSEMTWQYGGEETTVTGSTVQTRQQCHNTPDITNYCHGCSYLLDFRGNGFSKVYLHRNKKRRDPGEKTKPIKLST